MLDKDAHVQISHAIIRRIVPVEIGADALGDGRLDLVAAEIAPADEARRDRKGGFFRDRAQRGNRFSGGLPIGLRGVPLKHGQHIARVRDPRPFSDIEIHVINRARMGQRRKRSATLRADAAIGGLRDGYVGQRRQFSRADRF